MRLDSGCARAHTGAMTTTDQTLADLQAAAATSADPEWDDRPGADEEIGGVA